MTREQVWARGAFGGGHGEAAKTYSVFTLAGLRAFAVGEGALATIFGGFDAIGSFTDTIQWTTKLVGTWFRENWPI